jgi:hypothetical protein
MPRGGAGSLSCSADNGGDSAEVANAVSAQATNTQESTSRMARNKMPDFAKEKRRRKFKGELFGLISRSLTGSWIFCNKIGFSNYNESIPCRTELRGSCRALRKTRRGQKVAAQ